MKRLLLPLLAALALPTAVNAQTFNFDCRFRGKLGKVGIIVDEANKEVTYTYKKGSYLADAPITTFTNKASITSDLIKFGNDYKSWVIDRSTGRITQDSFKGKYKKTKTFFK